MSELQQKLKRTIMELLQERGSDKTICPSEAARTLRPDNWRPLMKTTRKAATSLQKSGKLYIEQNGQRIGAGDMSGPIRLRMADETAKKS